MNKLIGLLVIFAASAAGAQPTNAPPAKVTSPQATQTVQSRGVAEIKQPVLVLQSPKLNEIVKGKITYSGIAVAAVKSRHPLTLLSPLASPEYGGPEDSVVRDPATGRVLGLKLFALQF